jgi:hypothetical protein
MEVSSAAPFFFICHCLFGMPKTRCDVQLRAKALQKNEVEDREAPSRWRECKGWLPDIPEPMPIVADCFHMPALSVEVAQIVRQRERYV